MRHLRPSNSLYFACSSTDLPTPRYLLMQSHIHGRGEEAITCRGMQASTTPKRAIEQEAFCRRHRPLTRSLSYMTGFTRMTVIESLRFVKLE